MAQKTFTHMSSEGHAAILNALPQHYDMSLNREDMTTVLTALRMFAEHPDAYGADMKERAASLYSSAAETVGIELI